MDWRNIMTTPLGVTSKKKSPFKDIIQIKVDHPPTYPFLDKLFLTSFE